MASDALVDAFDVDLILLHDRAGIVVDEQDLCLSCLAGFYMQAPSISATPCGSIVAFGWTKVCGGCLLAARDLYGRVGAGRVSSDQHAVEVGVHGKGFPRWIVGRELDLRRIGRQPCLGLVGCIIVDDFDIDQRGVSTRRSSLHREGFIAVRRRVVLGRQSKLRRPCSLASCNGEGFWQGRVEVLIALGGLALCWRDKGEGDRFVRPPRFCPTSRSA